MTYTQLLTGQFGIAFSGLVGSVGYRVVDQAGTTRVARTTAGITERLDAAGNGTTGIYAASATLNTNWGQVRVIWDITGRVGIVAEEVVDTRLAYISAQAALIGGAAAFVASPISVSGTATIVRGRTYSEAAGAQPLTYSVSGIDLTDASAIKLIDYTQDALLVSTGSCDNPGEDPQTVVFEVDEAVTATLQPGAREFEINATIGGKVVHVQFVPVEVV